MLVEHVQKALPVLRRSRSAQKETASEADRKKALTVVKDDDCFASSLLVAVRILFGNQCLSWEPESLWLGFEQDYDIDVSTTNRNKLLAAITLVETPRFYADANVFEKTCLAFNNVVAVPGAINEASPAQMAWGVIEAQIIMQSENVDPEFDYEPAKYAAVSMAHDGLVLAPGPLVFAQEELNKLARSSVEDLKRGVLASWEKLTKNENDLKTYDYQDNPVDVQLAKLASIELYMRDQSARYQEELSSLL